MKRLVYSPKVNAWVKTDSGVVDLSDLVTRGSVNRKVNQVSGVQLTLRNPQVDGQKVLTEHNRLDGTIGPLLHPMDPIIITLTRLRGRPIQVFTGYCDSTPYISLYPGTMELRASCTLKRLMYKYWDPGLDFTLQFLRAYGWFPDQAHGGISAPQQEIQNLKGVTSFNDGSIGHLLLAVLTNIGGWDESTVYIEPLPQSIGPLVKKLFTQFQEERKQEKQVEGAFEDLLTQIIGTSKLGGGDPAGGSGNSKDFGNSQVPQTVYCVGVAAGASDRFLLAAMATGLVEAPTGSSFGNPSGGDGSSVGWRQETASSYPNVDRMDVRASAGRFYRECAQLDTGQPVGVLCQNVQRSLFPERYAEKISDGSAQALVNHVKGMGCN